MQGIIRLTEHSINQRLYEIKRIVPSDDDHKEELKEERRNLIDKLNDLLSSKNDQSAADDYLDYLESQW